MEPGARTAAADADGDGEDTIVSGGGGAYWRRWWNATSVPAQSLLGATAVVLTIAVGAAVLAANTRPHQRMHTVTAPATSRIVTTDAAGCPVATVCMVSAAAAPAAVTAAVHRAFPGAVLLSTTSTSDASSGRVYRRVVIALVRSTVVTVASQCIPGALAVPRLVLQAARTFEELDGSSRVLGRTWQVVTPGRAGCSAAVGTDTPSSSQNVNVGALKLAADEAVQLR